MLDFINIKVAINDNVSNIIIFQNDIGSSSII